MNNLNSKDYIENLRICLYPLGFISGIFFAARFILQWYQSEKKKAPCASRFFWHLSWLGNSILAVHAFIQLQFVIFFLQSLQSLLSWRNLNLQSSKPFQTKTFIFFLIFWAFFSIVLFSSQAYFLTPGTFSYFKIPTPFSIQRELPIVIHVLGMAGLTAFSLRFWIQWYEAEKEQQSYLSQRFFSFSIIGSLISSLYFTIAFDPVNCIGPFCSLIASIRNKTIYRFRIEKTPPEQPVEHSSDLVLIVGETSGDLLGSSIIQSLQKHHSHLTIGGGVAGKAMRDLGIHPWIQAERFQVMGIVDVVKKSFVIFLSLRKIIKKIAQTQPKIVVCIDQPSFSLALAKRLRKKNYQGKIIQVVAPTVWAYNSKRALAFASYFDLILPLYRFEVPYFSPLMPTVWAGHPIAAQFPFSKKNSIQSILALFPGSRKGEIKRNLPLQLQAAILLQKTHPDLCISISSARGMEQFIHALAHHKLGDRFELVDFDNRYRLMQKARAAIAKSGTVTLELALHKVPTVCCYETGFLTRWYAQHVLGIKKQSFALPNILSKENIFPEFIIPPIDPKDIAKTLDPYIQIQTHIPNTITSKILEQIDAGTKSADIIAREISCLIT